MVGIISVLDGQQLGVVSTVESSLPIGLIDISFVKVRATSWCDVLQCWVQNGSYEFLTLYIRRKIVSIVESFGKY